MLHQLIQLWFTWVQDWGYIGVVVLTGTGRAFCAGLDLIDATKGDGIGSGGAQPATIDLRSHRGARVGLLAPLVVNRKGYYTDLARWARGKGHTHLRVDREFLDRKSTRLNSSHRT